MCIMSLSVDGYVQGLTLRDSSYVCLLARLLGFQVRGPFYAQVTKTTYLLLPLVAY